VFTGLNIGAVYIIIHKREQAPFDFVNRCRANDGFVLITDGKGWAADGGGVRYELETGDMLLLRKGVRYEMHLPDGGAYITSAYDFLFDDGGDFPAPLPFVHRCTGAQMRGIREMCTIWQAREWDSLTGCRMRLLDLYLELMRGTVEESAGDRDTVRAMAFLHENFRTNFTGEDVARHCSLSLSHLREKFRAQTGCTITAYRDRLRIAAAREMLESRCFTIAEIAAELGYCDVYHFSRSFKRLTGCSPAAWRDRQK